MARGNAVQSDRQKTGFPCCPGPSVSLSPDPAPLEVTANFPVCINEIWTRGRAESENTICIEMLKKSALMNRISYEREKYFMHNIPKVKELKYYMATSSVLI